MSNIKVKKSTFGVLSDGREVSLYTVSNGQMSFSATDYGCTLTSIILPAKNNQTIDALLGFHSLEGWLNNDSCFGTVVGRYANRIGSASFKLDGQEFKLDRNDGQNTLHGGFDRWEKKLWSSQIVKTKNGKGILFSRVSYDGEQGFPGELVVNVTYTLNEKNELTLDYQAVGSKDCPVNLTNHAYFNLKGYNGGDVGDQKLELNCPYVLEVSDELIPTGKLLDVKDTCFDFTKPKLIGQDISETAHGYDHCFCLDNYDGSLRQIGKVTDPASGRSMVVKTTMPGVQFYTANFIDGIVGKNGFKYSNHGAFCLETQHYPDAPNKENFPDSVLKKGDEYHHITQYIFTC
jgi:aldose 1-epimerase